MNATPRQIPSKFQHIVRLAAVLCFFTTGVLRAEQAPSVSQYGITWTFDKPCTVGQFINGDYWVVGPVTIKEVTPAWDGKCNGSMVDPVPSNSQGYREAWPMSLKFEEELRSKFPLRLEGTKSLVSTIGLKEPKKGGASEGLDTAAVLTIVAKAPPADAFRPSYVAGDKPIYTASQIQWERLPKLPRPNAPVSDAGNCMKRVWLDHAAMKGNSVSTIHPSSNMEPYYFHYEASNMAMAVLLDTPERKDLACRLIQLGIDLYPISLENGDAWRQYGGFGNGRKWPILFAGIMLNDAKLLTPPMTVKSNPSRTGTVEKFGEDAGTWYGKPTPKYPKGKPLWGNDVPNQAVVFKRFMELGEAKASGDKDVRDPDGLKDGPSYGYRRVCSITWIGPALAAQLMGAKTIWNHPAFFDYVDRWVKEEGFDNHTNTDHKWPHEFQKSMWETYRPKADQVKQLPAPKLL